VSRAVAVFNVSSGSHRVAVRVLNTERDVHQAWVAHPGCGHLKKNQMVVGFCVPARRKNGRPMIVIPRDGNLFDTVPHEVTHAVLNGKSGTYEEEALATAIGQLSAAILGEIFYRGLEA